LIVDNVCIILILDKVVQAIFIPMARLGGKVADQA
jgi:hypothetical protein